MKLITYLSIVLTTVAFSGALPVIKRALATEEVTKLKPHIVLPPDWRPLMAEDVSKVKSNGISLPRLDVRLDKRDEAKSPDDDDDDETMIDVDRRTVDKRDLAQNPDDDDDDDEWIELTKMVRRADEAEG
ncbi:MAG: hypothetical protein Q9160_001617 [Pyrenula sp. 1 TL-2023]